MGMTPRISLTQNVPFQQLAQVTSVSGSIHGVSGFGSSLFLQRLFLPGLMALTEVDLALGMSFPATNSGGGTMYRSFAIYTFSNSTLLGSLFSVSGSSTWTSGSSTAGSVTQIQTGWQGSVLAAMTLSSGATLGPGEYVIGNLIDFSQATTPWTVSLFGASAAAITSSGGAFLSSTGLARGNRDHEHKHGFGFGVDHGVLRSSHADDRPRDCGHDYRLSLHGVERI
jgi:hypothetical protein